MYAEQDTRFDPATAGVPVYATQGGGYATYDRLTDTYRWLAEIPDFLPNTGIGDPIPEKWGVTSANVAAADEIEWNCPACEDRGCHKCYGPDFGYNADD
jgi:hypothetical protein